MQLELTAPCEIEIRGMQGQLRGVALVDPQDYDRLSRFKWHIVHSKTNTYARRYDGQDAHKISRYVWMHREVLDVGDFDGTIEIDHEDSNGLNNQRSNLIISNRKRNSQTRRKLAPAASTHRGVSLIKASQRWRAQIRVNGKRIYLGQFKTEEEAAVAARAGREKYLPHSRN
jgi:hypothetical protein